MPLSGYMDSQGGNLSQQDRHFLDTLPALYYADGRPHSGPPKVIVFRDPPSYYDAAGLELYPLERLRSL